MRLKKEARTGGGELASTGIDVVTEAVGVDEFTRERGRGEDKRPGFEPWKAPIFKELAEKKETQEEWPE